MTQQELFEKFKSEVIKDTEKLLLSYKNSKANAFTSYVESLYDLLANVKRCETLSDLIAVMIDDKWSAPDIIAFLVDSIIDDPPLKDADQFHDICI